MPTIVVTSLILNPKKDKFLIVKRKSDSKIHPSLWMFPGGKVEQGEDLIQALKREIKEETNLEISNLKKISEYEYPRPDGILTFGLCYSSISKSEEVTLNNELESYKWITKEEFSNYPHLPELDEEINKAF
tara:strand:+ start:155 stop:547 length:393 start_codon:yes stop_codon:yes gene_type:complete